MKTFRMGRILVALFVAATVLASSVNGQDMDRFVQELNHVFKNQDDEIVADGLFVKMTGSRIVVEEDGEEIKILMSTLSDEDQEWVRKMSRAQKAREAARKRFKKILEDNLTSGSDSKMATGLASIRKLGKNAAFASNTVERYTGNNFSEKVRYQAFMATIATKYNSDAGLKSALNLVIQDRAEVVAKITKSPNDFMMAMATFEDRALPYLKYAAFSGDLVPEDLDPIAPDEAVTGLDRAQAKVRSAAVAALATLPGEDTLELVLEILEAAENTDSGDADATSIRACLMAFGKMGMTNDAVDDKLAQHEEEFAAQVNSAREKIAKANAADDDQ
jgi:hypothetical protein